VSALQKQYEGQVNIIMVNVDAQETSAFLAKYNVRATPTFVLFDPHGQVAAEFAGWPGSSAVARSFDQVLAQP
jgi:thioredoxin-like negative regulator of GroEL